MGNEFIGNVSFVLQIIILALILVGSYYSKAKKANRHVQIMAGAIGLHTLLLGVAMIPSLLGSVDLLSELSPGGITTGAHVISGTLAEIWGISLIVAWAFAPKNTLACKKRKWQMRLLLIVWIFALVSGIIVHVLYI